MITLKSKVWSWIDEHSDEFIEVADKVWQYAELGLVETMSSRLIAEKLETHGFSVQLGVARMPANWGM